MHQFRVYAKGCHLTGIRSHSKINVLPFAIHFKTNFNYTAANHNSIHRGVEKHTGPVYFSNPTNLRETSCLFPPSELQITMWSRRYTKLKVSGKLRIKLRQQTGTETKTSLTIMIIRSHLTGFNLHGAILCQLLPAGWIMQRPRTYLQDYHIY